MQNEDTKTTVSLNDITECANLFELGFRLQGQGVFGGHPVIGIVIMTKTYIIY